MKKLAQSVVLLLALFTNGYSQTGYLDLRNGSSAGGVNDPLLSSASSAEFDGYGGPIPNSPTSNWYVAALTIGNSGRGVQIAHGYPNYNELYFRGGTDGWHDWRRILNDANYSSFALPLTGGTVTGFTQINNINFSGDADNYAGGAIWQDGTFPWKTHLNGYALSFGTGINGNRTERLLIDNSGKIGIGTATPTGHLSFGTMGDHLTIGDTRWGSQVILATGWTSTSSDYTDLKVPGAIHNEAYLRLQADGNVGIGTTTPTSKLTVAGDIHSRKVKVTVNAGADFVFGDDYDLKKLEDLQKYIQRHKHLPDIPSAKEMESKGIELGEMNIKLLQKIEELTLYIIQQQEEIESLKEDNKSISEIKKELGELKKQLSNISNK